MLYTIQQSFHLSELTPERIDFTRTNPGYIEMQKRVKSDYRVCGLLMYASLAITTEGLPLALTAVKYWTRDEFKNTTKMKRHINPARQAIEGKESINIKWLEILNATVSLADVDPSKIIHIGDRENDIFEHFTECQNLNTNFISRICVNRQANDSTLVEVIATTEKSKEIRIEFQNSKNETIQTKMEIKFNKMCVHPPLGKESRYEDLHLTVVSAVEIDKPLDTERIRWTFITNEISVTLSR